MEVLEAQNAITMNPIDFHRFVKNVEQNSEKSFLSKRNRRLRRQQWRQKWLIRSKIIPPSFKKIGSVSTEVLQPITNVLSLASFYDHPKGTVQEEDEEVMPSRKVIGNNQKQKVLRPQCKTTHIPLRHVASCERLKSNWKLQFRRDELNVLKFRREDDPCNSEQELANSQKTVQLRKIPRKFQEVKPQLYQIYKTNINALRDTSASSSLSPSLHVSQKIKYRTVNYSRQQLK